MNSDAIELLISKNPALKGSREKLEAMQSGSFCLHRSWGFGQIKDYDAAENKLIIDFEGGKEGHAMDPVFCVDKLDILPATNILVRQRTEPELIEELVKKRPADLVVEILSHCPDGAASGFELEALLGRLLGATRFKKWWTATKKALAKDPRIATPAKKNEPYMLRDEPLKPEQEVLEEYYFNKQPKKKILLAEKLYQISSSVEEIAKDLPQIFDELTLVVKDAKQITQADRLHGIWVRNDLARHLHEDVEILEPTSKSIILATDDLNQLAEDLPSHYYGRLLDLLTRVYPEEWETVIIDLMRNSSGKFTNECISFLQEKGKGDRVGECLRRWLDEQTLKGPVIFWIIKNRQSRKYAKIINGLINDRLLNAILYAIDNEALQMTGNRRIALADALSEDKDLIAELLSESTQETARDLAQTLLLNQGFEDLTKKSLLARFIKRYTSIQSLVAGEALQEAEQLVVSQESLDSRKREYEELVQKLIPENKEAIAIAREHGDLRENAEYKMARQDQETLMARKAQLEVDLSRARVTDFRDATLDAVGIGSVVDLTVKSTGKVQRYSILGAWDGAPEKDIVSYKTPLGQSLVAKQVGDTVKTEIDGEVEEWTIQNIQRWVDLND